tara:strand:- start:425 stop:904 length:480 start_codon:yes stop_codon:yes gene_type:complete
MRVAAGVLLLVVAASNLLGGCTYAAGGGLMGGIGAGVGELAVTEEFNADLSDTQKAEMVRQGDGALALGGGILLWGVFLLVLAGLEIAAGVQLFRSKGAMFIIIVAALEILSGVVTMATVQTYIFALFGMVAAILAIVAAKEFSGTPLPVTEPPSADAA